MGELPEYVTEEFAKNFNDLLIFYLKKDREKEPLLDTEKVNIDVQRELGISSQEVSELLAFAELDLATFFIETKKHLSGVTEYILDKKTEAFIGRGGLLAWVHRQKEDKEYQKKRDNLEAEVKELTKQKLQFEVDNQGLEKRVKQLTQVSLVFKITTIVVPVLSIIAAYFWFKPAKENSSGQGADDMIKYLLNENGDWYGSYYAFEADGTRKLNQSKWKIKKNGKAGLSVVVQTLDRPGDILKYKGTITFSGSGIMNIKLKSMDTKQYEELFCILDKPKVLNGWFLGFWIGADYGYQTMAGPYLLSKSPSNPKVDSLDAITLDPNKFIMRIGENKK